MLTLPVEIISILQTFATLFTRPAWKRAQVLIVGVLLTVGRRTVASALRTMGLGHDRHFQNYHRLLNRDRWSSRQAARILLGLLIKTFVPAGPLLLGGDETLERRRGPKITHLGVYRDAARSSRQFFVKSNGLRWICLMVLTPLGWAQRVWALPFLTVLAPSERYHQEHGQRHKTIPQWMGQMLGQVRRWVPDRQIVFVGDSTYSCLRFLEGCVRHHITCVTRLPLNAGLYEPAPERAPNTKVVGRPRKKGARLPTLQSIAEDPKTRWRRIGVHNWYGRQRTIDIRTGTCLWTRGGEPLVPIRWVLIRDPNGHFPTQALLCTDRSITATQIIAWYVQRWQLETTFQQARTHLGVETQRQWSEQAIERTTPVLLGLYSLVTLMAHALIKDETTVQTMTRTAAWYPKACPTFSDALALVRRTLWQARIEEGTGFVRAAFSSDFTKPQDPLWNTLTEILAYAA